MPYLFGLTKLGQVFGTDKVDALHTHNGLPYTDTLPKALVPVDGGPQRVIASGALSGSPRWSADGRSIAWVESQQGRWTLLVAPSSGGAAVQRGTAAARAERRKASSHRASSASARGRSRKAPRGSNSQRSDCPMTPGPPRGSR